MTAAALVAEARARGVELTPTPAGTLRVRPVSKLTPELLDALREHKPEILALLRGPQTTPSSWPATLAGHPGLVAPLADCALCTTDPRPDKLIRYGPAPAPRGIGGVTGG